jgi:hypothetical protein
MQVLAGLATSGQTVAPLIRTPWPNKAGQKNWSKKSFGKFISMKKCSQLNLAKDIWHFNCKMKKDVTVMLPELWILLIEIRLEWRCLKKCFLI